MSEALTHGSLFAGMGGLDLAIADVFGAETAWVSDVDPGANRILAHRYPDAPNLGDITKVDWSAVEPVHIISGGSPCPDLSLAGRRAGMTPGTRSNLWESMREAIAVIRPSFVVWENVYGALSANASSSLEHCPGCMGGAKHGGPVLRALGRVLGDLSDLGFDAQWHSLRAADVGACHGRFRVFVLAYTNDARPQGQPDQAGAAPAQRHGHPVAGAGRPDLTLLPTPAASVANDGEGPDTWLARRERVKLTAQNGNGMGMPLTIAVQLLPTPTSSDTNGAGAHGTGGADLRTTVALLPTPTTTQRGTDANLDTREGARANLHNEVAKLLPTPLVDSTSPASHGQISGQWRDAMSDAPSRWGEYAEAIARHEHAFGQPAPAPTEAKPAPRPTLNRHGNQRSDQTGQRLSASFVEWMMMLPAGWVTDVPGVTRNQALKALGNGVVPPQAAAALRLMLNRIEAA